MRVLIRVDSSPAIGMGHATRCLALAQRLRAQGATVEFATRDLPGSLLPEIVAAQGFGTHRLSGAIDDWQADAEQTLDHACARGAPDWIVVDHYGLDARWEKQARARCGRLLAIDDLADRDHDCDLLLDQNFHAATAERYRDRLPRGCWTLLGPRYALLRPSFAGARAATPPRNGALRRALISYGGTDPSGETLKSLHGLRLVGLPGLGIDVVVGASNPRVEEIRKFCADIPGTQVHGAVEDMSGLMANSDVALGAGGVTMWERCALGLPSIVTAVADNQAPSSAAMGEAGLCLYLGAGAAVTPQTIADALRGLAASPGLLRHLSAATHQLVDGEGARRVADAMLGAAVALRRAGPEDCDRVFAWRNHPLVRAASVNPAELDHAGHKTWFAAALDDHARDLLIVERAGQPTGVLRFDIAGDLARVSVFLDPGAAGRGIGTAALRQGIEWLRQHRAGVRRIDAEVLEQNRASLKAFANAGFVASRTTLERTLAHDA